MRFFIILLLLAVAPILHAQTVGEPYSLPDTLDLSAYRVNPENEPYDTVMVISPLDQRLFLPAVFTSVKDFTGYKPFQPDYSGNQAFRWIEKSAAESRRRDMLFQNLFLNAPQYVHLNLATLPEAPRQYYGEVDPKEHTIEIKEVKPELPTKLEANVEKKHWLRNFNVSLQFSQAYVSPNWYQGGNNNLNFLGNVYYNVKLNPAFHPNLLFENTFQYKLGLNSAPDDSLRNYSISDDLLQINTTFGYRAASRWYYSINAQFKTQLLNSHVKNTRNLRSAFLSPADFNVGVGMTYSYTNPKKTFSFDTSIAPISYNMKICTKPDSLLSHESFNIKASRKYSMKYGSTAEAKINWQLASNINFKSRVFVFSDYSYIQADWENTLAMNINRFLSTQIYWHIRYDSTTPPCDNPDWKKLQVKEILSFGISYTFSSI